MNGNYSRKKSIWLFSDGNTGKGTYQQLIMNLVGIDNVATLKTTAVLREVRPTDA